MIELKQQNIPPQYLQQSFIKYAFINLIFLVLYSLEKFYSIFINSKTKSKSMTNN